jgi:hypothetical protein
MKGLIPLLALGLAVAFTAPAFAEDAPAAPTTKADCEKMKDMTWDAATSKCMKK